MVPAKGVERWLSQRLAHRLGRRTGRRGRRLRRGAIHVAALAGGRGARPDRRRPVGRGRDGLAAAGRARRLARRGLVPACRAAPRPLRHRRRGRAAAGSPVCHRRPGWPGCSRRTPCSGPRCSPTGRRAGHRRPRRRPRGRPGLAARAVAAARRPGRRPAAARSGTRTRWPGCATSRRRSTLPDRLSLFGHTRLPVTEVELLDALAAHRDVHLWLPHPSGPLWDALAATAGGAVDRSEDASHQLAGHPLLATLARDSRELQRALAAVPAVDRHTPMTNAPDTLLGWLQHDLRGNTLAPAGRALAAGDRSVQVHACHGAARQVDVLREVLLGMLEADPTLEPRDILVMCPDIETYAPLITAGFGLGDLVDGGHPAHRLRVRLADRSLTQTNPLLGVAAQLLDIAGSRATASQVLDLAAVRAGPSPLRLHRRRPRHPHHLGPRVRRAVGLRPRAPRRLRARRLPAEHLARRPRPGAQRRGDVRRRPRLARHLVAARRRRQHPHRAGRPVRRVRRPAAAR